MNFKDWYYMVTEAGTSTACVALFSRPIFGGDLVSRTWPDEIIGPDFDSVFGEKKKKKKKEEN